jgi:anion-transporting  ArsA/GET3 family ATPase
MPTGKTIRMIRDPAFFGLYKKKFRKSKPMPYFDVSDDENENTSKANALKRKASTVNGHKSKRLRQQLAFENTEAVLNGENVAGPSQQMQNGTPISTKAKAIQEQRNDLPIAKGNVFL